MDEDCIKEILMFLSRESHFTGNKLVSQPQKYYLYIYSTVIQAGFPRTK